LTSEISAYRIVHILKNVSPCRPTPTRCGREPNTTLPNKAHVELGSPPVPLAGDIIPDDIDVVITLTTSKTPVYRDAARPGRLIVGVGAFMPDAAEIAARIVHQSALIVDDPVGVRHEAGDLIQANVDWNAVGTLAAVIEHSSVQLTDQPILFKSVGCAAWDLAAARLARYRLSDS
jgi:1-piperideine-2-carboxylate/1-pyrroline-2-carboxylate reductase [NAD(P)H]